MEIVTRAAVCGVIGCVLALLLRKHTPELSLTTAIITGMVILWLSVSVLARVTDALREIAEKGEIGSIYLTPVMKCVGISVTSRLSADVCRDAGQGSIASAVELCAAVCAVYVTMPLIRSLLAVAEKLL